jgi:hypothetical protein
VKILIDECLPVDLWYSFSVHQAHSAEWAGLKGRKNGELLDAAEIQGYDVLLTMDQGFPYQQNLLDRKISLLILVPRIRWKIWSRWFQLLLPPSTTSVRAASSVWKVARTCRLCLLLSLLIAVA